MATDNPQIHRVAIHKHAFGYKVDPGKLKIIRADQTHAVRFTNYTDKDIRLEFPPDLFAQRAGNLAAFREGGYSQDFLLVADEGHFEYAAYVTAAGIEAEGTSRPRILVER